MQSSKVSLLVFLGICGLLISNLTLVAGESPITDNNGDPYREIDTDLEYAFQNGSMFMYNNSQTIELILSDGIDTVEMNDTFWDYGLDRVTYHPLSNESVELNIKQYENITNVPACPIDISDWEAPTYDNNQTYLVNRTLVGVLSGGGYFPHDVYVDDLMTNDDSLFEAMLISFIGATDLELLVDIIGNLTEGENITIYRNENASSVDIVNDYQGTYDGNMSVDFTINDLEGVSGLNANLTVAIGLDQKLNCYHTTENGIINISFHIRLENATNTSQLIDASITLLLNQTLLCSTLLPCAWGYEFFGETGEQVGISWIWIILAILGAVAITLIIALLVQRSKCDEVKVPLDHLACRMGSKYKPQEK